MVCLFYFSKFNNLDNDLPPKLHGLFCAGAQVPPLRCSCTPFSSALGGAGGVPEVSSTRPGSLRIWQERAGLVSAQLFTPCPQTKWLRPHRVSSPVDCPN